MKNTQPISTPNKCSACGAPSRGHVFCFPCQKQLPSGVRRRVTKYYGLGDVRKYVVAVRDALVALRERGVA